MGDKECPICKYKYPKNCGGTKLMSDIVGHFKRKACRWHMNKAEAPPMLDENKVSLAAELCIDINDEATGKTRFACAYTNCPEYGKTWQNRTSVYTHWQNQHGDSIADLPVTCEFCPKRFLVKPLLRLHLHSAHPDKLGKEYGCSFCGKKMKNTASLNMHEKTHSAVKSFHCDYCQYKSYSKEKKWAHMKRMHADELGIELKLHQCDFCGKEFKVKTNLKDHIASVHCHKPDPKFQCHICNKQLKQDNSYRKHMANVHGVGERCEICNKLYKNKQALETHMKGVHEV